MKKSKRGRKKKKKISKIKKKTLLKKPIGKNISKTGDEKVLIAKVKKPKKVTPPVDEGESIVDREMRRLGIDAPEPETLERSLRHGCRCRDPHRPGFAGATRDSSTPGASALYRSCVAGPAVHNAATCS